MPRRNWVDNPYNDDEPCERCGELHRTRDNHQACRGHIKSGANKGRGCRNPLGYKTSHVGWGNCWVHGGNTETGKKGAENQKHAQAVRELESEAKFLGLDDFEEVHDPYRLLSIIAGKAYALQERLEAKVEELGSLKQYGGDQFGDKIDVVFEAYERALDRVARIGSQMSRLDLDHKIAMLQSAIDAETARKYSEALDRAMGVIGLSPEQRQAALREFGNALRILPELEAAPAQ